MSKTTPNPDRTQLASLESGLEALQSSPEFRGPVEELDGHACNDHFAQIYESTEERFAASIPFMRHGIERGERCMYVVDESSESEVMEAFRAVGIDIEEAVSSGTLTFHTVQDTYLRNGTFEPDEMIDFYAETVAEATAEFEALRFVAETSWLQEESTTVEQFMDYESKVNDLLAETDSLAMCQYDRDAFPPEIIRNVIQTHPHLIYKGSVCHNVYYTPPEEFFGPEDPAREVDRMLGTLRERAEAKSELKAHDQFLQKSYEITSDPARSFDEKLQALFELGIDQLGLDIGGMAKAYPEADQLEVEHVSEEHGDFQPGLEPPLTGTYCGAAYGSDEPASITDPVADGYDGYAYEELGFEAYLGTHVEVEGDHDRLFFFTTTEPRDTGFSPAEKTIVDLMGQWVQYELDRRQRERDQHELYETTAATDLTLDRKVQRILELGRERFDLEFGLLTRTDEDVYEVVQASGGGDALGPGVSGPIGDAYCRKVVDDGETVCITHAADEGWADDPAYEAQGLECYLGTEVRVGRETYGTLCFGSFGPRNTPVTDAEETFLDLMGQCVSYELEWEHHEAQLSALNEMGRHLMEAESRTDVAEMAVEHAIETLQLPVAAFVGYDETTGQLSPVAQTPRAEDELPTTGLCDRGSGDLWETFVAGETRLVEDVTDISGAGDEITGVLAVPLGSQGLFVAATTSDDGFPPAERDFVEATAATVEAASIRADRERQLQEREETLEAQNETLERLNRVNDIIRSIDQELVKASSRSEIDEVVCEQLAHVGPYELAWIGHHDPVSQTITPRESAGTAQGYLDDISISTDESPQGQGPTGTAVRTVETQVVNDILEDRSFEPWRQDALNRGYHATTALPLVYGDTLYGVLNVYAGEPGVFDGLERAVLDELADNIAYAINAVESKKALMSDEVTELEFTVDDRSLGVVELVRETGCEFSQESLVPREDGRLQSFFSTRGATEEAVLEVTPRLPITDVDLVSEHEEDGERVCLFEGTLTGDSLAATVLEHGGRIRRIDASDESATITVHLAADANIREFTEMLRRSHPSLELTAQRTRERTRRTVSEARAALTEELTDRQLEALQTAYVSGYFDQPRARTASEIAETMEIAQPTFNSHLRAAHRKLCRQLFDDRPVET